MATGAQTAAVAAALDRYGVARQRTSAALVQVIRRLWWEFLATGGAPGGRGLSPADARRIAAAVRGAGPGRVVADRLYDEDQVASLARAMARASRASQVQASSMAGEFQRQLIAALGQPRTASRFTLPEQPRGVDPELVWRRPAETFRYQRSIGTPEEEALERALERAERIADDDVSLGERQAARAQLQAVATVTGFRRVIRPELSDNGSCGLCVAASDRIYSIETLLPIHARCRCVVMPILDGEEDPGRALNREDLQRLYEAAGSTAAADLKRIRVVVHEHGELGPVLRRHGDHFRGPDEVERDARTAA